MSPKSLKLDQEYANPMAKHPYGTALYTPLDSSNFRPGSFGYFDSQGTWNYLGHLEDIKGVQKKELKTQPIANKLHRPPLDKKRTIWEPKTSAATKSKDISLEGGIDPATGLPITISSVLPYFTDHEAGAVLLTSAPISHDAYNDAGPSIKQWVRDNTRKILELWPAVKKYDLWIVNSTYGARECHINVWATGGSSCHVEVSVEAEGVAGAGSRMKWSRSQRDEGWAEYVTEGPNTLAVFFGGLKFIYKHDLFSGKVLKQESKQLYIQGGERLNIISIVPDPENPDALLGIHCEELFEDKDAH